MSAKIKKTKQQAQNPLILRSHRLMEAFAKSDDERDFYLDNIEGFIVFVDLDKTQEELLALDAELETHPERYCMIPKLTFYETKKIMEGFVNEKVYDIDTKEKLLDIIQSKKARENFLEFIYDHHAELEKWQQYYQERSRIRIIEWLRQNHFHFIFEEDLNLSTSVVEKLKQELFEEKVSKDVEVARKALEAKAKTYYSNEALNPRPKRGRPPKQAQKLETEHQTTMDIYTSVPPSVRPFLFTPDITSALDITFSSRFETGEELLAHRRQFPPASELEKSMNHINEKLESLRKLSSQWEKSEIKDIQLPEKESAAELDEGKKNPFTKLDKTKLGNTKKTPSEKQPVKTKKLKSLISKPKEEKKYKEKSPPPPVKRIIPDAKSAATRPARKIIPKKTSLEKQDKTPPKE